MSDDPPTFDDDDSSMFDDDNPEWTKEDFARARPISDFPELMAAFPNTLAHVHKKVVALALDDDVVDRFRAGGTDWRGRMNEALRKAAGL